MFVCAGGYGYADDDGGGLTITLCMCAMHICDAGVDTPIVNNGCNAYLSISLDMRGDG
jgi:hypothetical protein